MITIISYKDFEMSDFIKDVLVMAVLAKNNTIKDTLEVLDLQTDSKKCISNIISSGLIDVVGACRADGNAVCLDIGTLNSLIDNQHISSINIYTPSTEMLEANNRYITSRAKMYLKSS